MKIRKAIIPCGGMGTRFLPVTKAVPKEILPVIDTPVLKFIVDEIVGSGIDEILIILGDGKEQIRDFFTSKPKLEKALKNKPEMLEQVLSITRNLDIRFAMQKEPKGSGDAIMQARDFTGDEPFCMANGDDLMVSDVPVIKQLSEAYDNEAAVVVGVQKVSPDQTYKYGIINPTKIDGRTVWCDGVVEKPKTNPPSLYAALGRYVFTPEIYEYIERTPVIGGEVNVTNSICQMMSEGKVYAYEFDGKRYDMGDKFGALTASVEFGLKNPEFGDKFKAYLKDIVVDIK